MTTYHILSWNCQDRMHQLTESILRFNSDIIFLSEAYASAKANSKEVKAALGEFSIHGYQPYMLGYHDNDGRKDQHDMVLLAKKKLERHVDSILIETRHAFKVTFPDNNLTLIGAHLDDRSEERRYEQAEALLRSIDSQDAIVMGNLNAAHPGTWTGNTLHTLSPLIGRLPKGIPGEKQPKAARFGNLASRLTEMTNSHVLQLFHENNFNETNHKRQPTVKIGDRLPLIQLDHALSRGEWVVASNPANIGGSNHLPLNILARAM